MGTLIASLQPNASVFANGSRRELHLVFPRHCPLLAHFITTRHQMPSAPEHLLVCVSNIPSCHHHQINIHYLVGDLRRRRRVADIEADSVAAEWGRFRVKDVAVGEEVMGPVFFLIIQDALGV